MKNIIIISVLFLSSVNGFTQSFNPDNIINIKSNCLECYVSNQDNILSNKAVEEINFILTNLEKQTTAQVLVLAIKDIGNYSAQSLAIELFDKWKIGEKGKDNGGIIILALNNREVFISTGYGLEGAITDAKATRITNKTMSPYFKIEDYDKGMVAGVKEVSEIIIEEFTINGFDGLASKKSRDYSIIIGIYLIITLFIIIYSSISIAKSYKPYKSFEKEEKISAFNKSSFSWKIIGIIFPILFLYIIIWYSLFFKPRVRKSTINCSKCNNKMRLLCEKDEDNYLTRSQQVEEDLKSKDYDVWLCDICENTSIYSYDNKLTSYAVCDSCKAKALKQTDDRIIKNPSAYKNGIGGKTYTCMNCGNKATKNYIIPKGSTIAAGGVILGSGMGRGGGFSGGGSWGGGMSGGGGGGGRF